MKDIIGQENTPSLRFDAGNVLFPKAATAAQPRELAVAAGIMDIYAAMAYDAVAVGANDLVAGVDFLQKNKKMPWLSANLTDAQGTPLFPASLIVTRGDLRIGVIGLTGAVPMSQPDLRAGDWQRPLAEALDKLRGECHLLVVLSNLSSEENAKLAQNYPQIHLLVTADGSRGNVLPRPEQKPWVVQTMSQGKTLGVLTLSGPAPPALPMDWEIRGTRSVPLKVSMPEDAAIAEMIGRIVEASAAQ